MNWYKFIISQNLVDFLSSIGVNDNDISYIKDINDVNKRNFIIGILKNNPGLSISDIEDRYEDSGMKIPKFELSISNNFNNNSFKKWILFILKKHRKSFKPINQDINDPKFNYDIPINESDWLEHFRNWNNFFRYIYDWFSNDNVNIHNYNANEAFLESLNWHNSLNQDHSIPDRYKPTNKSNIEYGPLWENKEFNGYTIQRVDNVHDLRVEGNKMDHCVGSPSRCDDLLKNRSKIFSLRDSYNNPHVTIEMSTDGNFIREIQGKSNSEPKDIYKKMIKEWIKNKHSDIKMHEIDERELNEEVINGVYDSVNANGDGIGEYINALIGQENEYGAKIDIREIDMEDLYSAIINIYLRMPRYNAYMKSCAQSFAILVFNSDEELLKKYKYNISDGSWNRFSSIKKILNTIEGNREDLLSLINITGNEEEDIENIEYYLKNELPYGFDTDVQNKLEELLNENNILEKRKIIYTKNKEKNTF